MGAMANKIGEALWRIFSNRKSTYTAIAISGLVLSDLAKDYPTWKWVGVGISLTMAIKKVLSIDSDNELK
jgi:hypothetical protein